jgi:hypothetical protein
MTRAEDFYQRHFAAQTSHQEVYLRDRLPVYEKILAIAQELHLRRLVDLGCALGMLVELANAAGLDAYGFDFPIGELMEYHRNLAHSQGKFIYGSLADKSLRQSFQDKDIDAFIILDTLRYLTEPQSLASLNAKYIIIKDLCDNYFIRRKGRNQRQAVDLRYYRPLDCLKLFHNYAAHRLYPSKFLFSLNNPGYLALALINAISPTYTLILKHK